MAVMNLSCEGFHATVPFKSDVLDRVSCLWVDLNRDCSGWLTGKDSALFVSNGLQQLVILRLYKTG